MTKTTAILLAVFVLVADQWSKAWAVRHLPLDVASATLIPHVLYLTRTTNTGSAFGLFPGSTQILAFASLIAAAAILWYIRKAKQPMSFPVGVGLALPLGGALGNFIDRVRLGYVVDFIDLRIGAYHWPVFNVADSSICIGVALLAVGYICRPDRSEAPPIPATGNTAEEQSTGGLK